MRNFVTAASLAAARGALANGSGGGRGSVRGGFAGVTESAVASSAPVRLPARPEPPARLPGIDYPRMRRHRRPPTADPRTSTRRCNAQDARPANSSTSESEVRLPKPPRRRAARGWSGSRARPARSAPPCRGRPLAALAGSAGVSDVAPAVRAGAVPDTLSPEGVAKSGASSSAQCDSPLRPACGCDGCHRGHRLRKSQRRSRRRSSRRRARR